jgi:hypothetical protein
MEKPKLLIGGHQIAVFESDCRFVADGSSGVQHVNKVLDGNNVKICFKEAELSL